MAEQMTVKIRSRDGSPIRVAALARQIEQAGCEIVSVPVQKTRQWPPLRTVPIRPRHSTAPDFAPEVA